MSRFHFKGAGQQFRRPRPDARDLLNEWIEGGYYGGFYDITEPDGATSELDVAPRHNNDHVRTLFQLLPNGTAEDMVFMTTAEGGNTYEVPAHTWYRRDIVSGLGVKSPRKPMLFYPKGAFTGVFDGGDGGALSGLVVPVGDMGIPEGLPILEFTTGLYGMRMIHEIGLTQADLDSIAASNPQVGLPVPINPGTLIIRVRLEGDSPSIPIIEYFVNGQLMSIPSGTTGNTPVDHSVGLDMSQTLMMFSMPCWATQKMFNITRALDPSQIAQLHAVMEKTSEVYL